MITNTQTGTNIVEVAAGIYRISTPVHEIPIPGGFTFGQYLIVDDEPLLFHTGLRRMFPLVREAIAAVMPVEKLRYIGYSHFESDEAGAMNDLLAVAPQATPVASEIGTLTSLNDYADRPGRGLGHGEVLAIGAKRLRWMNTPHVPHGWDCGVMFEETTGTLLCGDLFTQAGADAPAVTESEVLTASEMMRKPMDYFAHATSTGRVLEELAQLRPKLLAAMHGSAYRGDGAALLRGLAANLEAEIRAEVTMAQTA